MHGVLTDRELHIPRRGAFMVGELYHLGDICTLANRYDISHIWVLPGSELSRRAVDIVAETPEQGWDVFSSYENIEKRTGNPLYARVRMKNAEGREGRAVKVGWTEYCRFGWSDIEDVQLLLDTVAALEGELHVQAQWSPGHMAQIMVRELNKKQRRVEWVREATIDLKSLPFNVSARDLIWKSRDLAALCEGLYLHQYDKNSSYLAACTGVQVGAGDPVHVEGGEIECSLPGIYQVSFDISGSLYNGVALPNVLPTNWATPDVIEMARTLGYHVEIHEGYQFVEKHRTLESWARALWDARATLRARTDEASKYAYRTVKEVALIGVGRFASKKSAHYLRPDWWAMAVGRARATMFRKIEQLRVAGHMPVLIYNDSIYYLSADPDPMTAVPGLLEKAERLGGFKHEYTFPVNEDIIEMFESLSPTLLVTALNELADSEEDEDE